MQRALQLRYEQSILRPSICPLVLRLLVILSRRLTISFRLPRLILLRSRLLRDRLHLPMCLYLKKHWIPRVLGELRLGQRLRLTLLNEMRLLDLHKPRLGGRRLVVRQSLLLLARPSRLRLVRPNLLRLVRSHPLRMVLNGLLYQRRNQLRPSLLYLESPPR